MAKRKRATDSWWSSIEAEPVNPEDSSDAVHKRFKRMRVVLVLLLVVPPLLAIGAFMQLSSIEGSEAPAEVTAPGKPEATAAVQQWLSSEPEPIPDGSVLSWEGSQLVAWTAADEAPDGSLPSFDTWVHLFTVANADASIFYEVTVRTSVDFASGDAAVVGLPSMVQLPNPRPGVPTTPSEVGWPGWVSQQAGPAVVSAIDTWLEAYISGEENRLRQAVGDPDGSNLYVPLTGVTDARVTVLHSARSTESGRSGDMLAHVRLSVVRSGEITMDTRSDDVFVFDLDLLLVDSDTASPRVVAWSGPGLGGQLVRFANAVPVELTFTVEQAPVADVVVDSDGG